MTRESDRIELPVRDFLYTLDQIAGLLNLTEAQVMARHVFFDGKHIGVRPRDQMLSRDISHASEPKPDWRVAEREFVRWMKVKGFRYHTRGYVS